MVVLPIEVSRRLEQLAVIERRSLSNFLQGLVLDYLETVPADKRAEVKRRLLVELQQDSDWNDGLIEGEEESEAELAIKQLEQSEW